jgi:4-hydroxy 2-oxovalerate aldolase
MNKNPKILDCTLRDGGYYVDWDFDESTVKKYLSAVAIAKIDIIELGFRFLSVNKFYGASAYSTDVYLNSINLPTNVLVSVMVNATELIQYEHGINSAVNKLFYEKKESPVDIVRIAVNVKEIEEVFEISEKIHDLGYRVFLNLMQVDSVNNTELSRIASLVSDWETIEVLYFADSLGSLNSYSVENIVDSLLIGWSGAIGIHAHDNKGLALSNSLAAHMVGVQYLDSTFLGMGRGAGNTRTEFILTEMRSLSLGDYYPDAIFPLILNEFSKLQRRYKWGPSIYYYLSASYGIHPTYIQSMLGDERYGPEETLSAINFLKPNNSSFFNIENMFRASLGVEGDEDGSWFAKDWAKNKTILIIGSGKSTERYIEIIKDFIAKMEPIVLCLNVNDIISSDIVDAYVTCHETRILVESEHYSRLNKPIVMPLKRISNSIYKNIEDRVEILDFGLKVEEDSFIINNNGCVLNSALAFSYAISVANAANANRILLVGVDGYEPSDLRQIEMVDVIKRYNNMQDCIPITAITPTTYPINQKSIFDPDIWN